MFQLLYRTAALLILTLVWMMIGSDQIRETFYASPSPQDPIQKEPGTLGTPPTATPFLSPRPSEPTLAVAAVVPGSTPTTKDYTVDSFIADMRTRLRLAPHAAAAAGPAPAPGGWTAWLTAFVAHYDNAKCAEATQIPITIGESTRTITSASICRLVPKGENGQPIPTSIALILTPVEAQYSLSSYVFPDDMMETAKTHVAELYKSGNPEILMESTITGAHTSTTQYAAYTWLEDQWIRVPGLASLPSVRSMRIENAKLILKGGIISSAGAGTWQRERTFTFQIRDSALQLTDVQADQSPTIYHLLQDAVDIESLANWQHAIDRYARVLEHPADKDDYQGYLFQNKQELVEGGKDPVFERRFQEAVRALAWLRLQLLQGDTNRVPGNGIKQEPDLGEFAGLAEVVKPAKNGEEARTAAVKWAQTNPAWVELLNAPFGYANRNWTPTSIAAAIAPVEPSY
ncbi:hypothetical protein [Paenibacillus sp. HJGM_3]|uniref:hypothetical protein n=1 Tax=Paenibacillus sp. HJGM_3 TaxID=3379816 RepID=UPI00385E8409